ncbi:stage II sporulation protein M [Candidatus Woesearchaeota archaeon]|nr:stage II sporulation protein M [Candidatus Woesearchaeota archaeon]
MVLELLFNPFSLKKKPWEMFIGGFFYSIVALMLSYLVFREIAGILMVFLIVLSTLPMVYTAIKNEEELDLRYDKEWFLLKEHTKVLIFLMFLFLGITVALMFAYLILPQSVTNIIFDLQRTAIINVNSSIQSSVTGGVTKLELLGKIMFNNIKVLFFCLLFSLLYGAGAIFILTWNASVIATAIGALVKTEIAKASSVIGFTSISSYFGITTFSFFRYMIHGFFEIAAYFIAGLAGGIISIALIKHNLKERRVLVDSLDLILISLAMLLVAALIEVFITPILFG